MENLFRFWGKKAFYEKHKLGFFFPNEKFQNGGANWVFFFPLKGFWASI